jgi:glutathione S-transferase
MKLYFAPWACSLAGHIALLEMDESFEIEAVDIRTKRTASGRDFREINPKGYVPALVLDGGETITENIAILDWIADKHPIMRPAGTLARTRLIEMLTFISTEIHRAYKPLWHGAGEGEKQKARENVAKLLQFAATQMRGDYLFGNRLSVADCYLFVMVRWAEKVGVAVPEALLHLQWRMDARPSVQAAIAQEELARPRVCSSVVESKVRENPEQHRFERPIHDDAIAAAYYRVVGGNLSLIHTEVPTEFSGLGIATDLARGTFELLRRTGRKAILICPFMVHFSVTHPEYADVIAA